MNENKDCSVVILAAGQGKRMNNPDLPKVLADLDGKPLLSYVLDVSQSINAKEIITIIGHKKELVEEYLKNNYNSVKTAYQLEQLGTGHAVMQSAEQLKDFDGNVLILCGDVPLLRTKTINTFIQNHNKSNADLSVLSAITENPTGYGRIVRDADGNFTKITEQKDASEEVKLIKEINSGIFLVDSKMLFEALNKISNKNAQGEYYLTDIVEIFINDNKTCMAFAGVGFDELQGINSPEDLARAAKYMSTMKLK